MTALATMEWRLLRREPLVLIFGFAFPVVLLVVMGLATGGPDKDLGGLRLIEAYVPILIAFNLAMLGVSVLPTALATYRERGVLRRLSTTPAHPLRLLIAQLITYLVTAVVALLLLIVVARVAFDVPLPRDPLAYLAAFLLGMSSLFTVGLLLAAIAPSARVATAIAIPLFFAVMFLGGVYIPRVALGEGLMRIGEFTPPGVQGLQDAWMGTAPALLPLVGMAVLTLVGGAVAVRAFKWE